MRIGVLEYAAGKEKEAQADWGAAKQLAPRDQAQRRQIAEAMAERGRWKEAMAELAQLEPLLESDPAGLIGVWRRQAELARRGGDRAKGVELLVRAYALAAQKASVPSSTRAELYLELLRTHHADWAASKGNRKKGLEELAALLKRQAATTPAVSGLYGEVLAEQGDEPNAVAALERALKLRPEDAYLLRRLVSIRHGEARLRDLERLFDLERADPSIGIELIEAQFAAQKQPEARHTAETMMKRFSDNATLLEELGRLLGKQGDHQTALGVLERATQLDHHPDVILAYADELRATSRQPEAVRILLGAGLRRFDPGAIVT